MDNTPPDWAMKEARRRIAASYNASVGSAGKTNPSGIAYNPSIVKPLAEMIAKHEQAPDDPDEVIVNDILNAYYGGLLPVSHRKTVPSKAHRFERAVIFYRNMKGRGDAS
jgi:hypothetical protein